MVKAETGKNIDIGIDKSFPDNNLNLSATTFYLKYKNDIKGWKSHRWRKYYSGGGYALDNSNSKTYSYSLELNADWSYPTYMFKFGYTMTESYDGTCMIIQIQRVDKGQVLVTMR